MDPITTCRRPFVSANPCRTPGCPFTAVTALDKHKFEEEYWPAAQGYCCWKCNNQHSQVTGEHVVKVGQHCHTHGPNCNQLQLVEQVLSAEDAKAVICLMKLHDSMWLSDDEAERLSDDVFCRHHDWTESASSAQTLIAVHYSVCIFSAQR